MRQSALRWPAGFLGGERFPYSIQSRGSVLLACCKNRDLWACGAPLRRYCPARPGSPLIFLFRKVYDSRFPPVLLQARQVDLQF